MRSLATTSFLSLLLLVSSLAMGHGRVSDLGVDTTPSAWCDHILPPSLIWEVVDFYEDRIERRVPGLIAETEDTCNRVYSVDDQVLTDNLILLVSADGSVDGARRNVEFIASDAERDELTFELSRLDGLGHHAVAFFRMEPRGVTGEFNVSFAVGDRVVEIKYFNVDDGLPGKFIQSLEELITIAVQVAARME